MPSVSKRPKPTPKSPKTTKRWKTAEELQAMLAERSGEPVSRIAVFGEPGNWSATLLVNPSGSAERRARIRALAGELRQEDELK